MKFSPRVIAAGIALVSIAGCNKEGAYLSIQKSGMSECRQLPAPQYEECIEAYGKTYDEYRRDLEQAGESK